MINTICFYFYISCTCSVISNCCPINDNRDNSIDAFDNCCMDTITANLSEPNFIINTEDTKTSRLCLPQQTQRAKIVAANEQYTIVCLGDIEDPTSSDEDLDNPFPNGDKIYCTGKYVVINNGNYSTNANITTTDNIETPKQYYIDNTDPNKQQTNIDTCRTLLNIRHNN